MLVVISDLHFTDGTAGQHNPPAKAFNLVFESLGRIATNAGADEVKIVLLGDIFDLLRTQRWFDVPADERPWGTKQEAVFGHARANLEAVLARNSEALAVFNSDMEKIYGFPAAPQFIYVIGNHDRLLALYPELGDIAREALGAVSPPDSPHSFADEQYGVVARHGHEYDVYNYDGDDPYSDPEHLDMPIGDPITTELASRLPYLVMRNPLVKDTLSEDEARLLDRNLKEIDNVRPLAATLRWLRHQVRRDDWLADVIENAIDQAVREFNAIGAVQDWYEKHDDWFSPVDEADLLQIGLVCAEGLRTTRVDAGLWLAGKLLKLGELKDGPEPMAVAARKELEHVADAKLHYVLYGHTHEPLLVPLRASNSLLAKPATVGRKPDDFYINTGAYRTWNQEAIDGDGFAGWKQVTYTIAYTKEEGSVGGPAREYPTFDTWTGNRYSPGV